MKIKFTAIAALLISLTLFFAPNSVLAGPKGAKAIFDSGEGPASGMSVAKTSRPAQEEPAKTAKFIGISYQLVLVSDDGQFRVVPKTRTFRSGERIKMLVRTNRPGYMTILNIGSSGSTHVLFNEYVDAFRMLEIPGNTNFRFVGDPGTEKILVMLSNEPNPIGNQQKMTVDNMPSQQPPSQYATPPPPPSQYATPPPPGNLSSSSTDVANLPPPPPMMLSSNMEGAKGAKDIMVEDRMQTSYTVISPKNNWKPAKTGMKDIVLESYNGNNYGVVPVSAIADGGILTLEIKLNHR
jgi:Domain of unknown function (DUF4384)